MIILIILIIVLLLSLSLINKTFKKKDNILEDVKLRENTIRNDGFALMLEQSDGTYEESTSSKWPADMKFNSELSGCIDTNGNKIDNSLSFDSSNNLITIKTNQTSYCYMYFDIKSSASEYLIENISSEELWNSPLEDDGYRYIGTNPDNYICFGTADKDTCIGDTDKYMYRIIGIFEDESGDRHAKLIKKEALNTKYVWSVNNANNEDWNSSGLYKGINGSYFLTNSDYSYMQDSTWTNKIVTWNYTMTNTFSYQNYTNNSVYGLNYNKETGKIIYLHELNRSSKSSEICHWGTSTLADCNVGKWKNLSTKISLMYASDYALSLGEEGLSYISYSNYDIMKTGWMYISNNDSNSPSNSEWTMSRYGWASHQSYSAWLINSDSGVHESAVHSSFAIRPVFYLESDVEFSTNSGDGSITNPYIIS